MLASTIHAVTPGIHPFGGAGPVAKVGSKGFSHLVGVHVADHDGDGACGRVPGAVVGHQVAGEGAHRRDVTVDRMVVGMALRIEHLGELPVGHGAGVVLRLAQPDQHPVPVPVHLVGGEGRAAQHLGQQFDAGVQVFRQALHVAERRFTTAVDREGHAQRIGFAASSSGVYVSVPRVSSCAVSWASPALPAGS